MSKLIPFQLVNVQTGERDLSAYVDAQQIVSWHVWYVPDPTPMGISRAFREKTLCCLNLQAGMVHWTEEDFVSVSKRILEARGQTEDAKPHADALKEKNRHLA